MKQKKQIVGVVLSNKATNKPELSSSIAWLDLKIKELIDKTRLDKKYRESNRLTRDFYEVLGALKFMYVSGVITLDEFNLVVTNITEQKITGAQDD